MVCIHALNTEVVTPDVEPTWHDEADGRVCQDCLQMFFSGALCLFNKRMWNINLQSLLLHCITCKVTHETMIASSLGRHSVAAASAQSYQKVL